MKLIHLDDINDPEVLAMLQAFYSRSHTGIEERVESLGNDVDQIKTALKKFYIGYGHASIGDCGFITLFIEDVSLLAAKAIQNHPLYNGQEKSTRYLNFNAETVVDPINSFDSKQHLYKLFELYSSAEQSIMQYLKANTLKPFNVTETVFQNTLKAKTFDVCRGFLPSSVKTSLSWTGTLRSIREHCLNLKYHTLKEVRELASEILRWCHEHYPDSFKELDYVIDSNTYKSHCVQHEIELCNLFSVLPKEDVLVDFKHFTTPQALKFAYEEELTTRPRGEKLPQYMNQLGVIKARFWLDFGSYRDIHRHRNGTILFPQYSSTTGIHPFYTNELLKCALNDNSYLEFLKELKKIKAWLKEHDTPEYKNVLQYYYPLGWYVPVVYTGTLPQWVYMLELRTQSTVHPTLRDAMFKIAEQFQHYLDINLYLGADEDLTFKRGTQTIMEKTND